VRFTNVGKLRYFRHTYHHCFSSDGFYALLGLARIIQSATIHRRAGKMMSPDMEQSQSLIVMFWYIYALLDRLPGSLKIFLKFFQKIQTSHSNL
jgi:hypothetical protein